MNSSLKGLANKRERTLATMTINDFLVRATVALRQAGIRSARLDALVMLSDTFNRDKAWVLAHDDMVLSAIQTQELEKHLSRRMRPEPLSYIRGKQEFYGREFIVTPAVLIPRPESEALIQLLAQSAQDSKTIVDVGTGSGALAITAQLEWPTLNIHATDISSAALKVAQQNAARLGAKIHFVQGNLLDALPTLQPDCIIANLPYVDKSWRRSAETNFEPEIALFADDNGLELIKKLITQAAVMLSPDGILLLEADPAQHGAIIQCGKRHGFAVTDIRGFCLALRRAK